MKFRLNFLKISDKTKKIEKNVHWDSIPSKNDFLIRFQFSLNQKLNEDICNLSTLCTTAKNQSQSTSTDKFANLMKSTEGENEQLTEAEITSVIHSMRKEVNFRMKFQFWKSRNKKIVKISSFQMANEFESTSSTQTGLNNSNFNGLDLSSHSNGDTKCQNDTICKAIEVKLEWIFFQWIFRKIYWKNDEKLKIWYFISKIWFP